MAWKKIREYDAKRLLSHHMGRRLRAVQVQANRSLVESLPEQPWLASCQLVVKPDMLFGKRGKQNLVLLKADLEQAVDFAEDLIKRRGEIEVQGVRGRITTCIVEPYLPHDVEYYLSIQSVRNGNVISFSCAGGMDVEENWDKLRTVQLGPTETLQERHFAELFTDVAREQSRQVLEAYVDRLYAIFDDLDFTFLEMNPLTIAAFPGDDGQPAPEPQVWPLDLRAELDSYAGFKNARKWLNVQFPEPWGCSKWPQERLVANLDATSSASLKLTVLNPKGRIWTMVAGGGASVIYSDTVVDLGYGDELANYAEYSGNPKPEETYLFARAILELATNEPDGRPRCLLIGGGIANFTDVAATFTGIVQALKDFAGKLQVARMKLFVRRGGPNYETGLRMMEEVGEQLGIPVEVYGPDAHMTCIVTRGIEWITGDASKENESESLTPRRRLRASA
ncbi:ATP citrate lyase [Cyanidioschyzon merolae strain 10D]|jgi:ATP citrate (pro-S)-lyase|uniref:ATP citrate synthase n=1 Tax=Cyanidioschyzon merolae (strain NIES-3377 / 10D) TaxID=280699 RepID=M1VEJ3_CYAM1|nr:ATP citrate lyase [Cyanidioschyzon merolae strain 10D]BAM78923.1 ATP citrate lyase [Cyanidioschyzon merolae strain 10D]|eukprot:XP_005535209.1 ATP citrate lyase [Cyanidioschyzon merolae strain 10D]